MTAGATVTLTGCDEVVAPVLSVATAVRLYVPAATLLHVKLNGLVVSVLLVACVLLMVIVPLLGGGRAGAWVVTLAAVLAFVLILYLLISPPGQGAEGFTVVIAAQMGSYIGLALAAVSLVGGLLAIGQSKSPGQEPTATHPAL